MALQDSRKDIANVSTNEFDVIEFVIGNVHYGINVAKVVEVINRSDVVAVPHAHPYVDGIFTLRGKTIPLINLPRCLGVQTASAPRNVIVSKLNNYDFGFLVNSVDRIHHVSWRNMEPAPEAGTTSRVVGVVKMPDRIVLLVDFEAIVAEIIPEINDRMNKIDEAPEEIVKKRKDVHLICAEDSPLLRTMLVATLRKAGYDRVRAFINGQDAWNYLRGIVEKEGTIQGHVHFIISDIEMPKLDGHHLLKLVRTDPRFGNIPFVLFSSLISEDLYRQGERLGANGHITKPEINNLIKLVDALIFDV